MANDYDNLPTGTKVLKLVAGLLPPLATWYLTGSVWYAIAVFIIGFVIGYFISDKYTGYAFRSARRDADGKIYPEDRARALAQSLPVFLGASPVCGAIAAAVFIWLSYSN
jgi:hypothetical protein